VLQVFQVNLKLFSPRRTVLLFAIRDRTRTPQELLEATLLADLERIWAGVAKPAQYASSALSDFFDVRFTFLPNFEERPEEFVSEAAALAARLTDADAPATLAARAGAGASVPGDALALSLRSIWASVRENRDLDLPAHRVMVATVRCAEIAAAALAALTASAAFAALRGAEGDAAAEGVPAEGAAAPAAPPVPPRGLGARCGALLADCLASYDADAALFDAGVRDAKRGELRGGALEAMRPAHAAALAAARAAALVGAKDALAAALARGAAGAFAAAAVAARAGAAAAFDTAAEDAAPPAGAADWAPHAAHARGKLLRDVDAHLAAERAAALAARRAAAAQAALRRLAPAAAALLDAPPADLWRALRALLADEAARADAALAAGLGGFDAPPEEAARLGADVASELRASLEARAREAAAGAPARLRDRFAEVFAKDERGLPRAWRPADDVDAAAAAGRAEAARALGALAVLRLDAALDPAGDAAALALRSLAAEGGAGAAAAAAAASDDAAPDDVSADAAAAAAPGAPHPALFAAAWEGVPPAAELLSPPAARAAWRAFAPDVGYALLQARAAQDAARRAAAAGAPLWALASIAILGFNEFWWLLTSPVTLCVLGVVLLFVRAVYNELDVEATLAAMGTAPGLAVLSARALPAAVTVLSRLVDAGSGGGAHAAAAAAAPQVQLAARGAGRAAGSSADAGALRRRGGGGAAQPAESSGSTGSTGGRKDE
jgi:hypothetical protein